MWHPGVGSLRFDAKVSGSEEAALVRSSTRGGESSVRVFTRIVQTKWAMR